MAGEKITEHGITAERLQNGDLRYSVNIMVDGQRIHRVIGRESDGVTRTQAVQFIEIKRTEAREGRLSLPVRRKTHLPFSQAARKYIDRLKEEDGHNIPRKRSHLDLHLKPFFKDQRLAGITAFTVGRYKKKRAGEGAAVATINRELTTLTHLLNKAVEWDWIKAVPCPIRKDKESEGRIIALTDQEADALLKAALADQDTFLWLFVAFGLNTAMRHGEILRTRFEHIDFDRCRLYLPTAKAGSREQPITPDLRDILSKERDMRDDRRRWIFPAARPKLSVAGHRTRMDRPFRRAVKRAGLDPDKITPHVMRHTAITALMQAGTDPATVQRISGHKTLQMVLRYTHVHGPHIDAAMRAIGRGIPERTGNETADAVTPKIHIVPKELT